MLDKFLREVVVIIVGKPAEPIAELLHSNKHVNEFIIAKKLDLTINQTRNILYKISDQGLVSSIRKKDKKKGWYTYFWKIEILKALEFLKNILLRNLGQIDNQIKSRETKQFYICERCNIEFGEETALLNNFTCNECGDIFTLKDNNKILRDSKKHKDKIEKELELIEVELTKEIDKLEKQKQRRIKKEEKEKADKRAAKRAETKKRKEAEKKAEEKRTGKKAKKPEKKKKVVKKKAVKKKPAKKAVKKKKVVKKKAVKKKPTPKKKVIKRKK